MFTTEEQHPTDDRATKAVTKIHIAIRILSTTDQDQDHSEYSKKHIGISIVTGEQTITTKSTARDLNAKAYRLAIVPLRCDMSGRPNARA